jgi:hypothetical protein
MNELQAFLGLAGMGTILFGAVIARLKVQSWLGAKRLAEINAEIDRIQRE